MFFDGFVTSLFWSHFSTSSKVTKSDSQTQAYLKSFFLLPKFTWKNNRQQLCLVNKGMIKAEEHFFVFFVPSVTMRALEACVLLKIKSSDHQPLLACAVLCLCVFVCVVCVPVFMCGGTEHR